MNIFVISLIATVAAAVVVVFTEYLQRTLPSYNFLVFIPLAILINLFLYFAFHNAKTLIIGVATFNIMVGLGRAGLSQFVLDEPIVRGNAVALAFLFAAVVVGLTWK